MKCPSCGAEQADSATECSSCFIVFYKWKQQQRAKENPGAAAVSGSAPSPRASVQADGEVALSWGLFVWVVPALLLLISCYYTFLAEGLPVPNGAYRSKEHGFALSVADIWNAKMEDVSLGPVTQAISGEAAGIGQLRIVTGNGLLTLLSSKLDKEFAPGFLSSIGEPLSDLIVDSTKEIDVDKLKAQSIVYSGHRTKVAVKESVSSSGLFGMSIRTTTKTPFEAKLKIMVVLVPGAGKGYYLVFSCPAEYFDAAKTPIDDLLKGFRVTTRPYSLSHIPALMMSPMGMGTLVVFGILLKFL